LIIAREREEEVRYTYEILLVRMISLVGIVLVRMISLAFSS